MIKAEKKAAHYCEAQFIEKHLAMLRNDLVELSIFQNEGIDAALEIVKIKDRIIKWEKLLL